MPEVSVAVRGGDKEGNETTMPHGAPPAVPPDTMGGASGLKPVVSNLGLASLLR